MMEDEGEADLDGEPMDAEAEAEVVRLETLPTAVG